MCLQGCAVDILVHNVVGRGDDMESLLPIITFALFIRTHQPEIKCSNQKGLVPNMKQVTNLSQLCARYFRCEIAGLV